LKKVRSEEKGGVRREEWGKIPRTGKLLAPHFSLLT
jgi:hypothetical protein